jgi:hypothetical protein
MSQILITMHCNNLLGIAGVLFGQNLNSFFS